MRGLKRTFSYLRFLCYKENADAPELKSDIDETPRLSGKMMPGPFRRQNRRFDDRKRPAMQFWRASNFWGQLDEDLFRKVEWLS